MGSPGCSTAHVTGAAGMLSAEWPISSQHSMVSLEACRWTTTGSKEYLTKPDKWYSQAKQVLHASE